jgi:hypothetical protein
MLPVGSTIRQDGFLRVVKDYGQSADNRKRVDRSKRQTVARSGSSMEDPGPSERDRRRHERFVCDGMAEVVVFQPELLFRGEVKDISLTGCYVATRARLNLKRFAEIELRFCANGQQLSSLARVMDVRPGRGLGVEFLPGDPRMNKRFRDLIEQLRVQTMAPAEPEL